MSVVPRGWVPGVGGLLLLMSCAGDGGGEPPGPPALVAKSSGDNQAWYFANPLPNPYEVTVSDVNNKRVPGVVVAWAVTTGGGSLSTAQSTTAANGVAATVHTLGSSGAVQTVTATVASLPLVTFTANATAPPTSAAVTVGNNVFTPQHVVIQAGGTVSWTWSSGAVAHNVTYTSGPTPRPASSPTQDAGAHSNAIAIVGRYDYVCTLHAGMTGLVTVVN